MNTMLVEGVARAVLYEGYVLYPYRPSSVKNRQRWTVGALCPESFCRARNGSDAWTAQAECLVEGDAATTLGVHVRFLQLLATGRGNRDDHDWHEAIERIVLPPDLSLGRLTAQPELTRFAFEVPTSRGQGASRVEGSVEMAAAPAGEGLFRLTVRIANNTPFPCSAATTHDEANLHSLVSSHAILRLRAGRFVSQIDPGEPFRAAAAGCRNVGLWPVLVGEEGDRDAMLAAPIILYDYPRVAPESHGDLFDATEIDEILTLRILTLTDREKQEMAAFDDRARALLARTEALDDEQLLNLHGVMRPASPAPEPEARSGARLLKPGDRVRLRPRGRSDAFDLLLTGLTATVASVEHDYEDQSYVTVLVDDDPGKDLGEHGKPGHRFFFRVDEVEPLLDSERGAP